MLAPMDISYESHQRSDLLRQSVYSIHIRQLHRDACSKFQLRIRGMGFSEYWFREERFIQAAPAPLVRAVAFRSP